MGTIEHIIEGLWLSKAHTGKAAEKINIAVLPRHVVRTSFQDLLENIAKKAHGTKEHQLIQVLEVVVDCRTVVTSLCGNLTDGKPFFSDRIHETFRSFDKDSHVLALQGVQMSLPIIFFSIHINHATP